MAPVCPGPATALKAFARQKSAVRIRSPPQVRGPFCLAAPRFAAFVPRRAHELASSRSRDCLANRQLGPCLDALDQTADCTAGRWGGGRGACLRVSAASHVSTGWPCACSNRQASASASWNDSNRAISISQRHGFASGTGKRRRRGSGSPAPSGSWTKSVRRYRPMTAPPRQSVPRHDPASARDGDAERVRERRDREPFPTLAQASLSLGEDS